MASARRLDRMVEQLVRELERYKSPDGESLLTMFEPLINKCQELARDEKEFVQCIEEAILGLREALKSVK